MNANVFNGILRAVIPAMVAYLVAKGYIPESSTTNVVAALIALGSAGWSIYTNWETQPLPAPKK